MLKMKSRCETCDHVTPSDALAYICSFECTFCENCAQGVHQSICPNCQGELVKRPARTRSVAAVASDQVKKKISNVFASK